MSYSACDFMDDVCSAVIEAGLVAPDVFERVGEDSGACASIVITAIKDAALEAYGGNT